MSVTFAKNVIVVNPGFLSGSDTLLKIRQRFVVIRDGTQLMPSVGYPSNFGDRFDTFVCKKKIFCAMLIGTAYNKLEVSIGKQLQTSANV